MKLPAFQFYPGDWLKDPNLRRCTHSAKGVWIDILCLMFESEERGVLVTAGRAWSDEEVACAVGGDSAAVLAVISELTLKGVANRRADGALYSKRMVRDENKRRLCSEAGKRGGNPQLVGTLKGSSKGQVKGGSKRNPTPSSSTSSSSSDIPPLPPKGDGQHVLPERWKNIPKQDRRNHRVNCNNRMMQRIGGWFGRKPETLWVLADGIKLHLINPAKDDVDLMEEYYTADIPEAKDYRRKDLPTLLNNWDGELDRARIWKVENQ